MTLVWFVVWLIANNVGGNEPLEFDPVNFWAAALLLAVAIDLSRPRPELGKGGAHPRVLVITLRTNIA